MFELNPVLLVGMAALVLDVMALVVMAMSQGTWDEKALWIVIVMLLPIVGAVLYIVGVSANHFGNWKSY